MIARNESFWQDLSVEELLFECYNKSMINDKMEEADYGKHEIYKRKA